MYRPYCDWVTSLRQPRNSAISKLSRWLTPIERRSGRLKALVARLAVTGAKRAAMIDALRAFDAELALKLVPEATADPIQATILEA